MGVTDDLKTAALHTDKTTKMLSTTNQATDTKTEHTTPRACMRSCSVWQYP